MDSREKAQEFKAELMETLRKSSNELLEDLNPVVEELVQKMRPALDQVQEWLSTFGSKIQVAMEQIGTTIDKVQKIFDQIMSKLSPTTGKTWEGDVGPPGLPEVGCPGGQATWVNRTLRGRAHQGQLGSP